MKKQFAIKSVNALKSLSANVAKLEKTSTFNFFGLAKERCCDTVMPEIVGQQKAVFSL